MRPTRGPKGRAGGGIVHGDRMPEPVFQRGEQGLDPGTVGDQQAVGVPMVGPGPQQTFPAGGEFVCGRTKIDAAGHAAVVTQTAEIDAAVAVGQGVEQASDPASGRADQADIGAVVKVRVGPQRIFPGLHGLFEAEDPLHRARDPDEIVAAPGQHPFKGSPGGVRHVVESAASPAGDLVGHLAKVDAPGDAFVQ